MLGVLLPPIGAATAVSDRDLYSRAGVPIVVCSTTAAIRTAPRAAVLRTLAGLRVSIAAPTFRTTRTLVTPVWRTALIVDTATPVPAWMLAGINRRVVSTPSTTRFWSTLPAPPGTAASVVPVVATATRPPPPSARF